MKRLLIASAFAPALGGCASIVEGTSQQVTVMTTPQGAKCALARAGRVIGVANPTPQTLTLRKSRKDVAVVCEKAGYQEATAFLYSDFVAMTLGNLVIGGLIGLGVDAATGAMNEYDNSITIPLTKEAQPDARAPLSTRSDAPAKSEVQSIPTS